MKNPTLTLPQQPKPKKPTRADRLDEFIAEAGEKCKLPSWNTLSDDVAMPPELFAALVTGRPELIKLAPARPLTAEECKRLYHLIGTLIETNMALRTHAEQTAQLVTNWAEAFKGLSSIGWQIERFANFKPIHDEDDDQQEAA